MEQNSNIQPPLPHPLHFVPVLRAHDSEQCRQRIGVHKAIGLRRVWVEDRVDAEVADEAYFENERGPGSGGRRSTRCAGGGAQVAGLGKVVRVLADFDAGLAVIDGLWNGIFGYVEFK